MQRLARASALRNSMLLLVLAGVWLFFYFATNGTFLTQRNLRSGTRKSGPFLARVRRVITRSGAPLGRLERSPIPPPIPPPRNRKSRRRQS
jgi:hypothetical protein